MASNTTEAGWELPVRRRCRVAIVGAGAAGLSAAQELLPKLSTDTTAGDNEADDDEPVLEPLIILEARDRVGGRIHTAELSNGIKVDMGAAWVHGTGVPYGNDGNGCDSDELNPMVRWLQKRMDAHSDTAMHQRHDPLGAGLIYTSPRGNADTRPRDVLHSPQGFDKADKDQHLMELYIGKQKVERDDANIIKALDMYEKILANASRIGAAAFLCREGMATSTISIGKTIDLLRKEAPQKYGLGYKIEDESMVETLLGFYLHNLQIWHPHDLANVQLSEFIADETDFEVGEDDGKGAAAADDDDDSSDDNSEEPTHDEGGDEGDFPGPHCNVQGGMGTILAPLQSNGVKECISYGKEVRGLDWKDETETIIVTCADGLTVEADYVVVTLPIACLKTAIGNYVPGDPDSIYNDMFRPLLSKEKEEAINMLQMGSYKKVFLTFDDIFWSTDATFIGLARSQLEKPQLFGKTKVGIGNYLNVDNTHAKSCGEPLLEITLAGGAAQWATERDSDEIKKALLDFMDESMCTNDGSSFSSRCTGYYITRWEEDEFSRGAYAGFKLGTLERHASALGSPEWNGRLLFAGDAIISEYEGSVHGALLSGKDAALKVLKQLDET